MEKWADWWTEERQREQERMKQEYRDAADQHEAEEQERRVGPVRELKLLNENVRELIGLLREMGVRMGWLDG